jgi:hypothetical protein
MVQNTCLFFIPALRLLPLATMPAMAWIPLQSPWRFGQGGNHPTFAREWQRLQPFTKMPETNMDFT